MSKPDLDEIADRYADTMLRMDGFDDCAIGIAVPIGMSQPVIAYSYEKVIEQNMSTGMSREDAVEYFSFNQAGAYMGEGTPIFIYDLTDL